MVPSNEVLDRTSVMQYTAMKRTLLLGFLERFRELLRGLTLPSRGGCVGDPIAWERDFRRRIEEREARSRPAGCESSLPVQIHVTSLPSTQHR